MTKIIDIHAHAFANELASKAISALLEMNHSRAILDGTVSDLRVSMKRAGISISVLQPVSTKPSQVRTINDWAKGAVGNGVLSFGTIYPGQKDWEEEIDRIRGLGMSGVKLHPEFQDFYPDDRLMFPIYEKLAAAGLTLLFHAGEDIAFSAPFHGTPERISRVVDNFPTLKVIAAHLGGFRMWDQVEQYLLGKELYLDTSYTFGHLATDRMLRIMAKHSFDRILFGTDSPWTDQQVEVKQILELDISDQAKEKILWANSARLLGL